jgi:hypothetical protein
MTWRILSAYLCTSGPCALFFASNFDTDKDTSYLATNFLAGVQNFSKLQGSSLTALSLMLIAQTQVISYNQKYYSAQWPEIFENIM